MKKNLFILLLILFCNILYAQPYSLTRGLPLAEISGTGTPITGLGYNNSVGPFNIGFSFSFFETTYTQFYLSSNGHISFGNNSATLVNAIPEASLPNNIIAFAAIAWNGGQGTPTLNYFTTGAAPNRVLVINFKNIRHNFSSTPGSLQIQLYETSGKVEIHYTSFSTDPYWKTTIGIENAMGSIGVTNKDLNNKYDVNIANETIRFEKITNCSDTISVNTSSNILCHGSSTLTASISTVGSYTYQWYKNSVIIEGANDSTYTATTAGTYHVRVRGNTNCVSQSSDIEIVASINPTLNANVSYICNALSITTPFPDSYTYRWFKDSVLIDGQTASSIIPQSTGTYKAEVISGNCSAFSNGTNISANHLFTPYNYSTNICNNITLGIATSSSPPSISYSWLGPNGFSSSESSPVITNATTANAGIYTTTVNFGCNDIKTATFNVTINPNTVSVRPTTSTSLCGDAYLTAEVNHTPNRTYSWAGPNGFSSTIINPIIRNVTTANAGIYTLTVNFGCGDIQTATTYLTISPNTLSLNSTVSTNICGSINLSVSTNSSSSSRTYLWTGPNGFSSNVNNTTINNVSNANVGIYTVTVNFGCGDVQTATTQLTVRPNGLRISPAYSTTLCSNINLFVDADYTAGRSYSWAGPNGFHSSTSSASIISATNASAGIYTVTVNFGCGDVQTATTRLTITPNSLSLDPSQSINLCGTTTFYPSASGDYSSSTFVWAGPNGFSSTARNPTISNVSSASTGIYTVTVNFGCGDTRTATTNLTTTPNTLSTNSTSVNICGSTSLYANASYTSSQTYSWTGPNGFSSNSRNPNILSPTLADSGIYSVTVNFGCGDIKTATSNLTVSSNTLSISPSFQGSLCGTMYLSVSASSTPSRTYSWAGPNGFSSTEAYPTIDNLTNANAGIYTVTVNFGCGDIQTATTNVSIRKNSIYASPSFSTNLCSRATLDVINSYTPYTVYSWAGPNGFNSTSKTPSINDATNADAGIYTVTVNFGCGDIQTATTSLSITPNTIALNSTYTTTICGSVNFHVGTSTTSFRSFAWAGPNGFSSNVQNPAITNVSADNAGIYTLTVNFGCGDTQTATTQVIVNPNTVSINQSSDIKICSSLNLAAESSYTPYRTYSWTGPNNFSSTSYSVSIPNVTDINEGVYSVTVNFGCGQVQTATTSVFINPNTFAIQPTHSAYLCGSANLYINTGSPNYSCTWAGPNGFNSTAQAATITNVTNANAGIYTVTVNFGCGDVQTATTNLTVNKNSLYLSPFIPANICGTVNVSPNVPTASAITTYAWVGPNGFSSTESSLRIDVVKNTDAGIYTLTINFGCGDVQTATTNLTVMPNRLSLNSPQTSNLCGNLLLSPSGTYNTSSTYAWEGPNGFTSSTRNLSITNVTNANAGVYTLTVNFGCGEILMATTHVNVVANTLSVNPSISAYICGSINLSANASYTPTRTYAWVGPNGFSSSDSTPIIYTATNANAGIYTLTVDFGCGKIQTVTTQVTLKRNVIYINPTTSASLCGTINLSANTSAYNATYLWAGPNGFSSTINTPTISNANSSHAGIYTVTVNSGCGDSQTATTNLSVNPISLNVSHDAGYTSCPGRDVELKVSWATPPNLTATYTWAGPGGFSSNKQNPTFLLAENSGGVYTVTANFGSCGISTATTTITMNPPRFTADASSYSMLCESNSVDLYARINGSTSETIAGPTITNYTWNGPDNFISHERNPTITNLTTAKAGFYTLTVDLNNGCKGSYTSQVAVNVTKNPELTTSYFANFTCAGNPVTLHAGTNILGNTSVNYLWSGPDGYTSTEARPTIANIGSGGIYTLTATFTGGCVGTYTSSVPIFNSRKPEVLLDSVQTVCLGQNLILSNPIFYNNFRSVWIGPNNFRSEEHQPIISYNATADMAGIYTLTLTDLSGACPEPFVTTTRVVINDCPPICTLTASNNSSTFYACSGNSVYLSSRLIPLEVGDRSYTWTGPNGFTSTDQNTTITNLSESSSGVYTITASSNLCSTLTATTFVGIHSNTATPTLDFRVTSNLCEGNSGLFSIRANNGSIISYSFTGPNNYTFYGVSSYLYAGGYDQITNLTTNMSGVYTVNATFQKICSDSIYQQSASLDVVVNPRPTPPTITGNPTTIEQGETTTLTASACEGNNTLQWFNSSSVNPLIDSPPVTTSYWAVCRSEGCISPSSNRFIVEANNCPQQFVLINPTQNYTTGTISKRAKASNGSITATNLVTGDARVIYQAKSILLNAGFKADNGTVFKAETGGCN